MQAVRDLIGRRHLATLICVTALLLKLLVPAGYMIDSEQGRPTIILCSGVAPVAAMTHMAGMHGDTAGHGADHGSAKHHGKAEMPCAFSGLSTAALNAIDPIQLAALIAFVLASGLVVSILPAPSRPARLRPPLRGPPAYL